MTAARRGAASEGARAVTRGLLACLPHGCASSPSRPTREGRAALSDVVARQSPASDCLHSRAGTRRARRRWWWRHTGCRRRRRLCLCLAPPLGGFGLPQPRQVLHLVAQEQTEHHDKGAVTAREAEAEPGPVVGRRCFVSAIWRRPAERSYCHASAVYWRRRLWGEDDGS